MNKKGELQNNQKILDLIKKIHNFQNLKTCISHNKDYYIVWVMMYFKNSNYNKTIYDIKFRKEKSAEILKSLIDKKIEKANKKIKKVIK